MKKDNGASGLFEDAALGGETDYASYDSQALLKMIALRQNGPMDEETLKKESDNVLRGFQDQIFQSVIKDPKQSIAEFQNSIEMAARKVLVEYIEGLSPMTKSPHTTKIMDSSGPPAGYRLN